MTASEGKARHLCEQVDWTRPELAAVKTAANPAAALVQWFSTSARPRHLVESEKKTAICAYLAEHYEAWRAFDCGKPNALAAMSLDDMKKPRAMSAIPSLGQAWWATGDERHGAAFEHFFHATPTGGIFNWDNFNGCQGMLDLQAYMLLQDCPALTADGRIAFFDHLITITENAWDTHTSRWHHLMLGPEGHNWYLHGIGCLPFVGLLFPEFRRSAFFIKTAVGVMEEHLRGHYKDDGGARETSLGYQIGSLHHMWMFYLMTRRNGYPIAPWFAGKCLRATMHLLRLMTPNGRPPSFGDNGFVNGWLTDTAAIAAAATGDRECKWYAERCRTTRNAVPAEQPGALPYSAFWSVGLEGALAYEAIRPQNPNHVSVLMGPSGYAALRDGDAAHSAYMAVAAADRGSIITSHGHTDIFSLEIHAGGVCFVAEPGCVSYGTSDGRNYDQKTEAHSTLTVDGKDQLPIQNEWRWAERVSPCVRRWISEPTHDFFHGVHEGYYHHLADEAIHARKIFFAKAIPGARNGYWIVMDRLVANKEHDYAAFFHGITNGRLDGAGILLEKGVARLAILPPANTGLRAEAVDTPGLRAFIAEKKLVPAEYPCFAFRRRAQDTCIVTVIVPLGAGETAPTVEELPVRVNGVDMPVSEASAVRIAFAGQTDWLCVSHKDWDAELEFGPHRMWGLMGFRREVRDGVTVSIEHTMADGTCGR